MKTFRFISVLLLSAGAVISSCSKESIEPEQEPVSKVKTYKVSVKSNNGVDTKATLEESGTTLSFTWNAGDKLTVFNQTTGEDITGTLAATTSGKTTRFEGELSGDIEVGNTLVLSYLSPSYNAQDGTLNGIANGCDYAVATVTVTSINGSNISTTDATFDLQQAFVKFTLKDKTSGNNLVPTSLTVKVNGMSDIAVTPANTSSNVVYVALAGVTNKTITLTAVAGGKIYTYRKTGVTFDNKKYYTITVKMSETEEIGNPLTLEARFNGTTITFNNTADDVVSYKVISSSDVIKKRAKINGGEIGYEIAVDAGDKVSFYGKNAKYPKYNTSGSELFPSYLAIIACDNECYIYGNVMSLIDSTSFSNLKVFTGDNTYAFSHLFYNNVNIKNHNQNDLVLPATTLAFSCYEYMFAGCTGLTSTPVLPATTLASSCYYNMFQNCSGLISATSLPATTLETYCYYGMFWGCSNLVMAPILPATSLKNDCYHYMFRGCTSLNYVKCLATDISATSCTSGWLSDGVPASGTFVKAASMTSWTSGASGIPTGWTVEDAS